jgi:hypothetical protein
VQPELAALSSDLVFADVEPSSPPSLGQPEIDSHDVTRTRASFHSHRAPSSKWRVAPPQSYHIVQIVADSNGADSSDTNLTSDLKIDAFSGANLAHINSIIQLSIDTHKNVRTFVVFAGINHRDDTTDNTCNLIQSLYDLQVNNECTIYFLSVPIFDHLSEAQKNTIKFINEAALDLFQDKCIISCTPADTKPLNMAHGGIHISTQTADIIARNLCAFLN